ncbi:MAG TPA: ATP-binding protein [Kofleriaceae bacterium]|nr:ATP-binding protein [Kofleriaceae bacterium]
MGRVLFTSQIEGFDRRVRALLEACSAPQIDPGRMMSKVLEDLATSLEELKVAEEELAAQNRELEAAQASAEVERRRYRELFMDAPEGYLLTDERGTIGEANQAAAALLGISVPLLVGKPLPLFIGIEDRPEFQRWLRRIREGELGVTTHAEAQVHIASRDRSFPCSFSVWRTGDRDGRRSLRWALHDLTLRDRARERDRFEEQSVRKDEFLAVLGHELRNPLAAIALAADVLGREIPLDEGRAAWATLMIRRHSGQLNRLVNDLLDVSRVYHGKVVLARRALDLAQVVTGAIETVQPLLRQKRHLLAVDLGPDPLVVDGDPLRLQQVMVNLLDNAAKYTPEGGRIEVRLRRSGESSAAISVRDSGVGIAPDMIDRVFGLFEQGGEKGASGLGIGLTLVRELVRMHGGCIVARSDGTNRGAEFIVSLPTVARPAAEPTDGAPADLEWRSEGAAQILIVDDNRDAADMVAMSLEELGHQVAVAYSADTAAKLVVGCTVALVDLAMPVTSGFELAPRLRAIAPELELIALTGFGDARNRADAEQAGFHHYVLKPVDIPGLDVLVRQLVAARARAD